MFELKESGEIRITRGDTSPELPLFMKKVYNANSLNEEGDVIIQFMPQDTELLSVGNYAYTVKLHNTVSGVVNTVIKATPFIIEG